MWAAFPFILQKIWGPLGDGGAVLVGSDELDARFRIFRNYGSEEHYKNIIVGANSRLDEIQAGMLKVKLKHLDEITAKRQMIAKRYDEGITNPKFMLPKVRTGCSGVYHQYVIRAEDKEQRESLIEYLDERGIGTIIHYPIPPHLAVCYRHLGHKRGIIPSRNPMRRRC